MAEFENEREDCNEVSEKVKRFLRDGCGCTLGPKNGPCSLQFTKETVLFNLNNCLKLSSTELDLVILTSIQAFTRAESIGCKSSPRCSFYFQSKSICKETFLRFYGVSYSRFRRLKEHHEEHGISPWQHGNKRQLPENTLPQSTIEEVNSFLLNYIEENVIVLPGGFQGSRMMLKSCHRVRPRRVLGVCTSQLVRQATGALLAILNSLKYGEIFTLMLWSQNQ